MRRTKWTSKVLTFLLVFGLVFSGLPAFALDGETYDEGTSSQNGYFGCDVGDQEKYNIDNAYGQNNGQNSDDGHGQDKSENLDDGYNKKENDNLDYGYGQDKDNNLDYGYGQDKYNNFDNGYDEYGNEKDIDENYDYDKYCLVCEYCECEYCECAFAKIVPLLGAVDWEYAKNSALANLAGRVANPTFGAEWAVMAIARGNFPATSDFFDRYYESIVNRMAMQTNPQRVSGGQSTDTSRVAIALTAIGRDPTNVGGQHNLIGTGGLGDLAWITNASLNNAIYALIALNTNDHELPSPAVGVTTREALISNILNREAVTDGVTGGWSLFGGMMDPDVTGMAITALAPYYCEIEHPDVFDAINRALDRLATTQQSTGDWVSVGGWENHRNSQSAAQVIVALSALGIDAQGGCLIGDRFVTDDGYNPVSALLTYFNKDDGGFRNTWPQVVNNARSDGLATAQAAYALVAYDRFLRGVNSLYNMRDADGVVNETNINRFVLNATIVQAQRLIQTDFTPASWAILQAALAVAIDVRDDINATQNEIDEATLTLRDAIASLVSYNITVFISFEGATLGHGFYIEPVRMTVPRGSTVEDITRSLLTSRGHAYDALLAAGSEFMLERVYSFNAGLANPPNEIMEWIKSEPWRVWMDIPWYFLWSPNGSPDGSLGNDDYLMFSGWMLNINNVLGGIGASIETANDGDVIRWQFSLAMGDDLGADGTWDPEQNIFEIVDKSVLIRELFAPGINQSARQRALDTIINPLATENDVRLAIQALRETPSIPGQRAFISVTDPFSEPGQTRTFFPGTWIYINENETVYTLLRRTGLNIETRGHVALGNKYIVSINGWGEFSDGPLSGWVYSVNGVPGQGASGNAPVSAGDRVEWLFTRNLGYDVFGEQGFGAPGSAGQDDEIVNLDIEVEANVEGGVATAEITTNMVREAIAQLAEVDEEITGLKFIITKEESVNRVEVELIVGVIREMLQNELSLTIMSDLVTRTFDLETLLGLAYGEANSARVTVIVEVMCVEEADVSTSAISSDGNIIALKVKIDGNIVSEFVGFVRVIIPFVRPIIMPISDTDLLTVYHIGENENLQEMLGAQYRAATMTFSSNHLGEFFVSEWINPFDDVERHDWYMRNVRFVYSSGLMSGVASGEFAPEADLSRAMIATILWRLAGEPDATSNGALTDVEAGRWYANPAIWANTSGVVASYDNLFDARGNLTYEQLLEILINFAAYQELRILVDENQKRQVTRAELTTLFGNTQTLARIPSSDIINRAQVAAILQVFIENTTEVN